mgnify:CR=1 FL=1|tara:strand:- start:12121 stop:12825 length:705 start_codon:yes stop_codon:yes gene_type:complete
MENTITRIADLPDSINNNLPQQQTSYTQNIQHINQQPEQTTNYIPLNTHPNPYGVSDQNPIMKMPEQVESVQQEQMNSMATQQVPQYLSEEQREMIMPQQQQRLPSRHIHHDTTQYSQDKEVQPNYIPKKSSPDYVRDYEDFNDKKLQKHENDKKQSEYYDDLITDFQVPVLVAILYFLFQLPIINTFIFKRFSFLSIYNDDGNFNFYGLLFKSLLFGNIYYTFTKITNFLISL